MRIQLGRDISLSGFLPESLTQCTNLKLVHLSKNKFKGAVPPAMNKAPLLPSSPRTGVAIPMQIFPTKTADSDSEIEELERAAEEAEMAAAEAAEESAMPSEFGYGNDMTLQEAGGYYDEQGNWIEGYYDEQGYYDAGGNWVMANGAYE